MTNENSPAIYRRELLRVLQERTIRRVGGTKEIELDVRILAATSLNLPEEVRQQRFRLDLYHRIHVAQIDLPPLRERAGDIPLLIDYFVMRYANEMGKAAVELSPEVVEVLTCYAWPGNVRELQNVIKRTLALAPEPVIAVHDLPDEVVARAGDSARHAGGGFFEQRERRLASFERQYFRALLQSCHGDMTCAARGAELPRGTLYRLLKKHGLDPNEFRGDAQHSQST